MPSGWSIAGRGGSSSARRRAGSPAGAISLSIQNEQGRPVAAALGATLLDGAKDKTSRPVRCGLDLSHAFLSDGALKDPAALESVNLAMAGNDSEAADGTPTNADHASMAPGRCQVPDTLLDLVLGCQKPGEAGGRRAEQDGSPLVLFDNLDELQSQYEAALSEYRAQRTHVVNALIMLSFFGGLALALFVTMLALLRIVWGSRLWLPTVVATVCCVVVTAVSNDPSRMKPIRPRPSGSPLACRRLNPRTRTIPSR